MLTWLFFIYPFSHQTSLLIPPIHYLFPPMHGCPKLLRFIHPRLMRTCKSGHLSHTIPNTPFIPISIIAILSLHHHAPCHSSSTHHIHVPQLTPQPYSRQIFFHANPFSLNPLRVATLTRLHQSLPLIVNTGHLEAVGPCSWAAFHRCSVTGLEVVSLISHIWKGRCIGLLPSLLHWACVASSIFWVHGKKRFREGRQHGH